MIVARVIVISRVASRVITLPARSLAAVLPSFSMVSERMGMNAAERAPSPKSRRNRLGILKATSNADFASDVPKKDAMRISRTSPRIRLMPVKILTVDACFISFIFAAYWDMPVEGHP